MMKKYIGVILILACTFISGLSGATKQNLKYTIEIRLNNGTLYHFCSEVTVTQQPFNGISFISFKSAGVSYIYQLGYDPNEVSEGNVNLIALAPDIIN